MAVTLTLAKLRCVQASVYLFLANHPTQAPHPVHSLARNSNVFLILGISFPTPWGEKSSSRCEESAPKYTKYIPEDCHKTVLRVSRVVIFIHALYDMFLFYCLPRLNVVLRQESLCRPYRVVSPNREPDRQSESGAPHVHLQCTLIAISFTIPSTNKSSSIG